MKDSKTDVFKNAFDKWLSTIPNEPQTPDYKANRRAESNSIRHMTTSALRESKPVPSNSSHMEASQWSVFGGLLNPRKRLKEVNTLFIRTLKSIELPCE